MMARGIGMVVTGSDRGTGCGVVVLGLSAESDDVL